MISSAVAVVVAFRDIKGARSIGLLRIGSAQLSCCGLSMSWNTPTVIFNVCIMGCTSRRVKRMGSRPPP